VKGALKSSLGRSLVSSGIGPLLSQVLALALVPVLFRLYTPQDFGVWAAVQAIAVIAGSLVSLRFDLALVLERDLGAASQLLYAIIGVVVACSIVVALLLVGSRGVLGFLGVAGTTAALGWGWLVLIGLAVVLQSWLMREGAFGSISIAVILNAVVTNIVQLAGGIWGHGVWLIIGSIAGQTVALIFYTSHIMSAAERPIWRSLTFNETSALLWQHKRFLQFSLPFTVLSLLRERAPIFIIGAFGPPALVGLYSQAWRLTHFPSGLTSAALRPVFFHRTATEGLAAQGKAVDRFVRWLLLASSPWIGFVAFGNDALFNLLLGVQWQGAGHLAAVLVLPAALFTITNWMDRLLDAVGRQDVNLKVEMVAGLASVSVLWVALAAGGSLTLAVILQSSALVLSYVGFIWICYGIAGWPRSALVVSLCVAAAVGGLTYLFLVMLGLVLSQTSVFLVGAASAMLITIAILMTVQKEIK
jgi:O-antigen/teichoic acid export membrane protein